ncbi:hypothetical protein ABBQ38_008540 [Trebouxia sp. C0009 RCD-2024]
MKSPPASKKAVYCLRALCLLHILNVLRISHGGRHKALPQVQLEPSKLLDQVCLWQTPQALQVVADKLLKACLSIAPGHSPLHVQYVWDADVPWQLLLLFEAGGGLCEA